MQVLATLITGSLLAAMLAALPEQALAHGCPGEMYKIDKALAAKPKPDPETLKKVRELRAEGERLHKENKHGESMLVLGSAKRLLKID
jgi:hypothetical protein